MAYSYDVVRLTKDKMEGIMPPWVLPVLELEGTSCFAALDKGDLKGVAVYTKSTDREKAMVFLYIYIAEECRKQGLAKELLKYSEEMLKAYGSTMVFCKCMGDIPTLKNYYKFLLKNKFMPLSLNSHFLMYHLASLKKTDFYAHLEKLKNIADRVKYYDQVDAKTVRIFLEQAKDAGYSYATDEFDTIFAGFYLMNDKVEGFLDMKEVVENILMLKGTYVSNRADQFAIPAMIANALKISDQVMPQETSMFLQISNDNDYRGLKGLFGDPEIDYTLQEYVKSI